MCLGRVRKGGVALASLLFLSGGVPKSLTVA